YCVTNANFMHPRCKRGRVEWGKSEFYLLRYKRKFYASALQTRTSGSRGKAVFYLLRCKRGRVEYF
ncbi:MAG TPA: hypothetical protein PLI68_14190, partial [Bacteroidia bacterium]|nr:hypothetical protein [Bacteroidia bacterium]